MWVKCSCGKWWCISVYEDRNGYQCPDCRGEASDCYERDGWITQKWA